MREQYCYQLFRDFCKHKFGSDFYLFHPPTQLSYDTRRNRFYHTSFARPDLFLFLPKCASIIEVKTWDRKTIPWSIQVEVKRNPDQYEFYRGISKCANVLYVVYCESLRHLRGKPDYAYSFSLGTLESEEDLVAALKGDLVWESSTPLSAASSR